MSGEKVLHEWRVADIDWRLLELSGIGHYVEFRLPGREWMGRTGTGGAVTDELLRRLAELREAEAALVEGHHLLYLSEQYQDEEAPKWRNLPAVQRALARDGGGEEG